jgi:serine/threonine-protein phosphatase 2B catalytic subunit
MSNSHLEKIDKIASKISSSPLSKTGQDFTAFTLESGEKVKTTERICKGIIISLIQEGQAPACNIPTDEQFYSKKDPTKPDLEFLKNHFLREGRLSIEQALYILKKGTAILKAEETLLELESPLTGIIYWLIKF